MNIRAVGGLFTSPTGVSSKLSGFRPTLVGASVETTSGRIAKKIIDADIAIYAIMESRLYMRTRYGECRIAKQYFQRDYRQILSQLSFGHA